MLFTHFGLSGPVVLDISRHWIAEWSGGLQPAGGGLKAAAPQLSANFLPDESFESLEKRVLLGNPHSSLIGFFRRSLPDRLVPHLVPDTSLSRLTREERRRAIQNLIDLPLPVIGDRGFQYAEVTAGGVPLTEIDVSTMASRQCEGVYLCGEILDVDGKIGGYNFQWAWASGRLAGRSAGIHSL